MTEKKEFDVFLCHNSDDKDIVKLIAEKLEKGGIKTWLDEREFVGGDDWIKKLYETLAQANVVFVFLGTNGIGKWHSKEIEHSYSLYVDSGKKPIIVPILLFGATFDHLPNKLNYLKDIHSVKIDSLNDNEIMKLLQVFTKTQPKNSSSSVDKIKDSLNFKKINRIQNDIKLIQKEYDNLTGKINVIVKRLDNVIDPLEKESLNLRRIEFESERKLVEKKLEQLEYKLAQLQE
jgi:hypothetical protein